MHIFGTISDYSSKKYVKENASPNLILLFLS